MTRSMRYDKMYDKLKPGRFVTGAEFTTVRLATESRLQKHQPHLGEEYTQLDPDDKPLGVTWLMKLTTRPLGYLSDDFIRLDTTSKTSRVGFFNLMKRIYGDEPEWDDWNTPVIIFTFRVVSVCSKD